MLRLKMQELTTVKTPSLSIAMVAQEVSLTSSSSLSHTLSSSMPSSPLSALIEGSSSQRPLKCRSTYQVLCVKQSWTGDGLSQMSMWRRGCESSWAYLSLALSSMAISFSRPRVATTTCSSPSASLPSLQIGPLTSFHRCFPIRSSLRASDIQLRLSMAKVS